MSLIYIATLVLNPIFYIRYIILYQPKKQRVAALKKVKELQEQYREVKILVPTTTPFLYKNQNLNEPIELEELDAYDCIALARLSIARPSSIDEFEDYNSQESYDPGKKGALAWWYQDTQRQRWPRLSLMAIDILSIPAMSDEPERVFSGCRRTIPWDRASMLPETLEQRECLKHWIRSGIINVLLYKAV